MVPFLVKEKGTSSVRPSSQRADVRHISDLADPSINFQISPWTKHALDYEYLMLYFYGYVKITCTVPATILWRSYGHSVSALWRFCPTFICVYTVDI